MGFTSSLSVGDLLYWVGFIVLFIILLAFVSKRGRSSKWGKDREAVHYQEKPKVKKKNTIVVRKKKKEPGPTSSRIKCPRCGTTNISPTYGRRHQCNKKECGRIFS